MFYSPSIYILDMPLQCLLIPSSFYTSLSVYTSILLNNNPLALLSLPLTLPILPLLPLPLHQTQTPPQSPTPPSPLPHLLPLPSTTTSTPATQLPPLLFNHLHTYLYDHLYFYLHHYLYHNHYHNNQSISTSSSTSTSTFTYLYTSTLPPSPPLSLPSYRIGIYLKSSAIWKQRCIPHSKPTAGPTIWVSSMAHFVYLILSFTPLPFSLYWIIISFLTASFLMAIFFSIHSIRLFPPSCTFSVNPTLRILSIIMEL